MRTITSSVFGYNGLRATALYWGMLVIPNRDPFSNYLGVWALIVPELRDRFLIEKIGIAPKLKHSSKILRFHQSLISGFISQFDTFPSELNIWVHISI